MTINDIHQLAQIPLKQLPNRVWRTYSGGALIDRWKGISPEIDSDLPEQWIMSTITARGNNRPEEEGLSMLQTPAGNISLKSLIDSNKALFLGERLANKFGTTGVLIKMLDANERLTIQVHPDKQYAKNMFQSAFGKTESWYVLNTREVDGQDSVIYMGFKTGVTKEKWKHLFDTQNIEGMLNCLHKFPVKPGDAFMIYGGVPHAIGSGCFLLEVQEPTDYTMRVEKTTPAGLKIADTSIHQGLGEDNMLDCFHYDACSFEDASKQWKIAPRILKQSNEFVLRAIFDESHTDCFALQELDVNGLCTIEGNGSFFVGVVYSGSGNITCNGKDYAYTQGDEIFFSAAIEQISVNALTPSKILLCYPPS